MNVKLGLLGCSFGLVFVMVACGGGEDENTPDAGADCGNGVCESTESAVSCSADCASSSCGDGTCDPDESPASCPADCGPSCGDGVCDPGESTASCAEDCPAPICTVSDPNSCSGETVCIAGSCENAFGRNYKIKIVSAVFTETNAGGGTWDALGGLPDGKATVTVNGVSQTTPTINDTLTPTWNFVTPPTLIPGGTNFKIEVVDDDIAADDVAWSCVNNPLSAELLRAGARCSGVGPLANAHVDILFTPN